MDVSPSGTKVLITDDTLIDLRFNKKIKLNWSLENHDAQMLSRLFWTSDETRIYRCCYFYADLAEGIRYSFKRSGFQDTNGSHLNELGLWFHNGLWVRGDSYFLVRWQTVEEGDPKYLPMFNPATKIFYDVREMAGIPKDFTGVNTSVSPDGNYVWTEGSNESYLVNLSTFESQHYSNTNSYSYTDVDWSPASKFTWFAIYGPSVKSPKSKIHSITDMKLHSLAVAPASNSEHSWHPTDNIVVYPGNDENALVFLDASTVSIRELPFKDQNTQYKISDLTWNSKGDKLIFITESHILWQVDYPSLENLKQIMASPNTIGAVQWSPDDKSISLLSGPDIYIVDAVK